MQLTELLFQKVKDLPADGQLSLKSGYVAVVSKASSLRTALTASVCPAPDDPKRLTDGAGPTRVGVGLLSGDGRPYRLLRELGGSRQLLRFDPATKRFEEITEDQLEIDSFLRVECGMPPSDAYTGFFVLEINELPSLRGKAAAAANDAYVDQPRVRALKEELEMTRKFEAAQDRLFKVAQRLHDLKIQQQKLKDAEADLAAVQDELKRSPWPPEEIKELTTKASRAKEDLKKRDDGLADVVRRRQKAAQTVPPLPEPVFSNTWFYGGLLLGIAVDALAYFFKRPPVAVFGLVPLLAPLIVVLRWIEGDEADKQAATYVQELKEREVRIKKDYEAEQAPLKAALRAAKVDSPVDLLALFKDREVVVERRETALERLQKLKLEPEVTRLSVEIPLLESEKTKLEDQVHQMGFSRPIAEIEADLKHALGISASKNGVAVPEVELPRHVISRAAELLNLGVDELWSQMSARLTAYLHALTDKRVVSGKPDDKGMLVLGAPDGRTGSFMSLPPPLRDLVYAALRLTLLERVAGYKRLPVVVDDAFAILEAPKRALIGKMLKGIGTQTQVIHRVADAPAPGTADLVLQA
ncbi:MAG: hypothetical protein E6J84_01720 [Deltaproteobacteria bacterium]|nr:MAG: hypothetical protein E6J84_01720 [Deltaproteobacteria bacterium]